MAGQGRFCSEFTVPANSASTKFSRYGRSVGRTHKRSLSNKAAPRFCPFFSSIVGERYQIIKTTRDVWNGIINLISESQGSVGYFRGIEILVIRRQRSERRPETLIFGQPDKWYRREIRLWRLLKVSDQILYQRFAAPSRGSTYAKTIPQTTTRTYPGLLQAKKKTEQKDKPCWLIITFCRFPCHP